MVVCEGHLITIFFDLHTSLEMKCSANSHRALPPPLPAAAAPLRPPPPTARARSLWRSQDFIREKNNKWLTSTTANRATPPSPPVAVVVISVTLQLQWRLHTQD